MRKFFLTLIMLSLCSNAFGDSLNGSKKARAEAHAEAEAQDKDFAKTAAHIEQLVSEAKLVSLRDGQYFEVDWEEVSYPFVLPETREFAENISSYLLEKCRQTITITGAVRPLDEPEPNSAGDTVHPTGMALDLREWHLSDRCKDWFESRLRYLEHVGVIQATEETSPKHYHVVVYPRQYTAFVSNGEDSDAGIYKVRRGDTLSMIALRFRTTTTVLANINKLQYPDRIKSGQKILFH